MCDDGLNNQKPQSRRPCFAAAAMCSAVIMLTYLKPAALKLRHQSMLTSSSQCTLNVILRRCKMTLVYENARVFVEMMTGGHVRLLKAVPVTYQNIDIDAVVDQDERSRVDHRRRSRQRSVLIADLSACCGWSRPDPAIKGSAWLLPMILL